MITTQQEEPTTSDSIKERLWGWVREHPTQMIALVFWTLVIIFVRQYMQANDIGFRGLAIELSAMLTGTWYGPILYIVIYLLRPLILFPASLLTLLAGNVFGLGFGFIYGMIGGTASSTIPYSLGRWFRSEGKAKKQVLDDDKGSRIRQFLSLLQENPFQAVLTMRLLFLPYDAVSLIVGALRIAFIPFFLATTIGNIGGTFAYVAAGASIEGDVTTGEIRINPSIFALSITILIVSFVITRILNKGQEQ